MSENISKLPVVPLRGIVVFPKMRLHFELGREKSINAINSAMQNDGNVFLVSQIKVGTEDPAEKDLYQVGVIAHIEQTFQNANSGKVRVVINGLERAKIISLECGADHNEAEVISFDTIQERVDPSYRKAIIDVLRDRFEEYANITNKLAQDVLIAILDTDDLGELADIIAGNAIDDFEARQTILEEESDILRAEMLVMMLGEFTKVATFRADLDEKVQARLDQSEREYYLREEMKIISSELQEDVAEAEKYRRKIRLLKIEEVTANKLLDECVRLSKLQPYSPEANVIRSYLDAVIELPWRKYTKENYNVEKARKILDKDHYGLDKVKDRFLEMLCIRKLGAEPNGQIICLVGPPGVGKTSIASCVAKAMGRNFARISLGGVNDEAEIRGHRKTYIGSMPGRIMEAMVQAGSKNPLILLDEIDKIGKDYKGDPAAALLEVLDGEQNNAFVDHYLDVPFDLSQVIFVTTANDPSTIPPALYDRMEKIEMDSYTFEEKLNIATKHLLKKQMKLHGLTTANFKLSKPAIGEIIEKYTREAGVRELEKKIATVCRKAAVKIVEGTDKVSVTPKNLEEFLPSPRIITPADTTDKVGAVNGLAWTAVGGEMLEVEAVTFPGTGKIELTGNLGDVMKESAKLAVSVVRSVADEYGIDGEFYKNRDIHIHAPQGAVPKDGPSAGVTMSTALLSALTGRKVRGNIAMTGEISLTGRVMPIGGLKEKSMAAYKNGIKTVLIPKENEADIAEISDEVKNNLEFVPVSRISQVFSAALI